MKTKTLTYLITIFFLLIPFLNGFTESDTSQVFTLSPPIQVIVKDTPNDGGGSLSLSWTISADDEEVIGDLDGYEILRANRQDTVLKVITLVADNTTSYVDRNLNNQLEYIYGVRVKRDTLCSDLSLSNYAQPKVSWFRKDRLNIFVLLLVFSAMVLLYIRSAKLGKKLFVRKISGLSAVEEAVGRSTEMGKPVLFIPGIQELDEIQTIAGLSILEKVAKITASYDTPLIVPVLYPMIFAAAGELVKGAYLDVGKPENYKPDIVRYVAGEQFAYAAAVNGIMLRERPAAHIFMGAFYAESLLLAETGQSTGAIQIAGTANPDQLPFFIVACDYTLMGEELYAASAYLSHEPLMLGSLKGQDLMKILLVVFIIAGVLFATFDLGDFVYKLFIEH